MSELKIGAFCKKSVCTMVLCVLFMQVSPLMARQGMDRIANNVSSVVEAGDVLYVDGYMIEVVTPDDARKFRSNYETYINGLEDIKPNLLTLDYNYELRNAIKKQRGIMRSEPGQADVMIVFGLKSLETAPDERVFVQMIYPVDRDGQIIPFTRDKVYLVSLPTKASLSNTRGTILNCPPYCD